MVEVDTVTAVVAALVRPGRVLRAGPQPHPHRGRHAARELHRRVRRPVGQREAEGRPRSRARRHPPVRAGGPRRPDRQRCTTRCSTTPSPPCRSGSARSGRTTSGPCSTASTASAGWWYRADQCVDDGIPWVIEVAVADTVEPGDTWFACNHSPSFGDPLDRAEFEAGDIYATGAESFLMEADADTGSGPQPRRRRPCHLRRAAVHRQGQGRARRPSSRRRTVRGQALDKATKTLRQEAEQRRKDASKAERAEQRRARRQHAGSGQDEWTLKEAVFEVMPEAKEAAGHNVAARTLYYKVRPLVQELHRQGAGLQLLLADAAARVRARVRAAGGPVLRGARRTAPPPRRAR